MSLRWIILPWTLCCSLAGFSANFVVQNSGITGVKVDEGYVSNFRVRIVAGLLYDKSHKYVTKFMNKYSSKIDVVVVDGDILNHSGSARIYNFEQYEDKFTMVVTADMAGEDRKVSRVIVHTEDFDLGEAIDSTSTVYIELLPIEKTATGIKIVSSICVLQPESVCEEYCCYGVNDTN